MAIALTGLSQFKPQVEESYTRIGGGFLVGNPLGGFQPAVKDRIRPSGGCSRAL